MSKSENEAQQMRVLGRYEQTCGEMPPADLLDAESSRQLIQQLSRSGKKSRSEESRKNKQH
ncbi:MAG: hypothetical protein HQM04_10540 [Magnetococcales bacterium]|nr:hypothetical protein [Magnetococcales bacterium]MBF0115462.1 hypothetical protein [Magnetococcales bacterium]